jgi:hypothetical protein
LCIGGNGASGSGCVVVVVVMDVVALHQFLSFCLQRNRNKYLPRTFSIFFIILVIYLIPVHIYPTRLGNPLDVKKVIVRNAYTHKNKIIAIK